MYDDGSSEGGPKGTFEIYRAEGDVLFKRFEFKKALNSYSLALELKPGEKNCLVARSQCYLKLGDPDSALLDAESTLEDDKNYIRGLLQKAEALYQKGDFEYALVFYHRGNKLRPEVKGFRLGIQKCQEAIDNSIGTSAGVQLSNEGDLTYFYEADELWEALMTPTAAPTPSPPPSPTAQNKNLSSKQLKEKEEEEKKKQEKNKRKGFGKPKEEKKERKRTAANSKDTKTIKQLLGELYNDKEFLENLLQEMENSEQKTETNAKIKEIAIAGLDYLDTRTDFWQQQKPMYSRKRDKKMRDDTRSRAGSSKRDPTRYVLNNLEKIDEYQANGDYDDSLKLAKKTLKEIEKWSEDDVQNREEIVANIHSSIGNAYLEKQNFDKALSHHNKDLEIATQHNLEDAKSRALDNIGRAYARTGKFEKAIEVWEKKLPLSKTDLETTWLCHEIGRCHLECKRFEKAKEYGDKALEAAEAADDDVWQLNASVLIAQAQVKLGDHKAALEAFEKSLELAQLQNDQKAEKVIKRAIKDCNDRITKELKENGEEEGRGQAKGQSQGEDEVKGQGQSEDQTKGQGQDDVIDTPKEIAAEIRASNAEDDQAAAEGNYSDDYEGFNDSEENEEIYEEELPKPEDDN